MKIILDKYTNNQLNSNKLTVNYINYNNKNVNIVEDNSYDIILGCKYEYKNHKICFYDSNNKLLDPSKPFIFFADEDGCSIYDTKILAYPLCIGYIKDFNFTKLEYNYIPRIANCIHFNMTKKYFNNDYEKSNRILFSNTFLKKVHTAYIKTYYTSILSNNYKNFKDDNNYEKDIDVFFSYRRKIHGINSNMNAYRDYIAEKLNTIKKNIPRLKIIVSYDLDIDIFHNYLKKSKLVIVVFGSGEWTYTDNKAFYSKCIVLKPYNFIKETLQFYDNCVIQFDLNCINLEEKIIDILGNYEYYFNKLIKTNIEKYYNLKYDFNELYNIIHKCYSYYLDYGLYDNLIPRIIDENETIDIILQTNLSLTLFTHNDIEYIIKETDNIAIKLKDVLLNSNSEYEICLPNIFDFINDNKHITNSCLKNKKNYRESFLNLRNKIYFHNLSNKIINENRVYFSSFINTAYYFDEIMKNKENYKKKIMRIFDLSNNLVITNLAISSNFNLSNVYKIDRDWYKNINKIENDITEYINNLQKIDIVILMLDKFSPLLIDYLTQYYRIIDIGIMLMNI